MSRSNIYVVISVIIETGLAAESTCAVKSNNIYIHDINENAKINMLFFITCIREQPLNFMERMLFLTETDFFYTKPQRFFKGFYDLLCY